MHGERCLAAPGRADHDDGAGVVETRRRQQQAACSCRGDGQEWLDEVALDEHASETAGQAPERDRGAQGRRLRGGEPEAPAAALVRARDDVARLAQLSRLAREWPERDAYGLAAAGESRSI